MVGIGEMAGVFTRGLLKLGHPIFPVTRRMDMDKVAKAIYEPALVLVAVGENDLHPTLEKIPAPWRDRLGLLQNELLRAIGCNTTSATPPWSRSGSKRKRARTTRCWCPHRSTARPQPVWELKSEEELTFELVRKNVYILTTNIAGLALPAGATVDTMWQQHQALAREVADEVMDIQFKLIGQELDREKLITGMVEGIDGDLAHKCMGRSAPGRLTRALQHADQFGLAVPKLRAIASQS